MRDGLSEFNQQQQISILGISSDEQSSWARGAAKGPDAIRAAFHCESTNTFCESGFDIAPVLKDHGNLQPESGEAGRQAITDIVSVLATDRGPVLILGGDHSITCPVVRGIRATHDRLAILHFDAHPDLYDSLDGNRWSHATPFARIMEAGLANSLMQIGIRTMNAHQRDQANRFSVDVLPWQAWNETELIFADPVYISIDMDVLDPAYAPGVSHQEPGGMATRELLQLIQRIKGNVVGADIVELNPQRDVNGMTARVAAKILKELAACMIQNGDLG